MLRSFSIIFAPETPRLLGWSAAMQHVSDVAPAGLY